MHREEEEAVEQKDFSRPFFLRRRGEVGLYIDTDEVEYEDAHAYGSPRLLMADTNEKLAEQLTSCDLVKVKADLETQGHFRGIVLEEFRRGSVLAVLVDGVQSLVSLWSLSQDRQLALLLQPLLVPPSFLSRHALRKFTLRVRVWPDELQACREEIRWMEREGRGRLDFRGRPRDVALLQQTAQKQTMVRSILRQLQGAMWRFERTLDEFLQVVKQKLPKKMDLLPDLQYFDVIMTAAMETDFEGKDHVIHYLTTLGMMRNAFTQAEVDIYLPLTSIPARGETREQRDLKERVRGTCKEMLGLLHPSTSLRKTYFKLWEDKLVTGERTALMGLISLIPLGVEKMADVEQDVGDYLAGFPGWRETIGLGNSYRL